MSEMTKMKAMPARTTCTYPEAVHMLHAKGMIDITVAHIIAYIYGRDVNVVLDSLKKGMP